MGSKEKSPGQCQGFARGKSPSKNLLTPLLFPLARFLLALLGGLFLRLRFGLLSLFLRRFLRWPGRLGSRGPRRGSRGALRLLFADNQFFLFGFHYIAAQLVIFFQP